MRINKIILITNLEPGFFEGIRPKFSSVFRPFPSADREPHPSCLQLRRYPCGTNDHMSQIPMKHFN